MLKKIPVSTVRIGMYLHSLEGSWLNHSMWKTRFLVEEESDLQKLRNSGADEVWIDETRGLDADGNPTVRAQTLPDPVEKPPRDQRPASMAEELQKAREIRGRAKAVVTSIFQQARMGNSFDASACAPLVEDIVDSVYRNNDALVSLSRLKLADEYTYMHSVTVCALMVSLGRQLGFDQRECHDAGMAGLMHDLGKASIPLSIINKPGKLTDAEFEIIRTHPERGHALLVDAGVTNQAVLQVCRHHHERMDGKGYPDKLESDRVPLMVRMSAVCDVYDAVTSNRPYNKGWDPAESISRMASWKGHFDEEVLRAFIKSLGIYPTGSLVRLQSGRLAVVMGQNADKLTAPRVKVFFSTSTYARVEPEIVDLNAPGCSERIIGRESPEKWQFPNLGKLWMEGPG